MSNRVPAGPERPTPFERILNALRLPNPITCLLLAVLAGGPGFILIEYARSRDWDQTLRFVFSQPGGATWEGAVASLVFVVVNFLVFYGIADLRNRLVSAKEYLVALLQDDVATYRQAFRHVPSAWPIGIALVLEGISAVSAIDSGALESQGLYLVVLEVVRFLVTFGIITFVWVYATGLGGLHQIGKRPLRLRPHWEDTLVGTRPIGQISLRFAAWYYVVLFLVIVGNALVPEESTPWTVAILAVIGVIMFFLPLTSIHRTMSDARSNSLLAIRSRVSRLLASRQEDPGTGEPLARLDRHLQDMTSVRLLEMELREASTMRTWPFDIQIIGQLTVILVSVAAALLTRLLQVFLNL